jgi:hypothetical protein
MLMTKKDTSRHHQLQIEFPDEHMRKYWLDNNIEMTPAELKDCVEGRMRCYWKQRGWHQTSAPVGPGQHFPIELYWEWYEPPL